MSEIYSWMMVAFVGGVVCSPDGMMAVICNFRHIRSMWTALVWAFFVTLFHGLFGCVAAAITVYAADMQICAMLCVRVGGILLTGYFAKKSIEEALSPGEEFKELRWVEVLLTTAVVGSLDSASFAHGTAVHLAEAGFLSATTNWLLSSVVVGAATFAAGLAAWRGGEHLKQAGQIFLVVGAVTRVGLFFGLIAMLVIGLGDYFAWFHLPLWSQLAIELAVVVAISAAMYGPTRRAQRDNCVGGESEPASHAFRCSQPTCGKSCLEISCPLRVRQTA